MYKQKSTFKFVLSIGILGFSSLVAAASGDTATEGGSVDVQMCTKSDGASACFRSAKTEPNFTEVPGDAVRRAEELLGPEKPAEVDAPKTVK